MNIWIIKANEPLPIPGQKQRLFRMGLLADELQKRKHKVTWFTTTFDHFSKKQLFENDKEISVNNNYTLEILWSPKYTKNISISRIINHKYLSNKIKKKMKKLEKPDIIYVSFPIIDLAEVAIEYGEKNSIPVIIDIRDLWPDIFKHNLNGIKKIVAIPYIKLMDYKTKKIMKNAYAINGITPQIVEWGLKKANRDITEKDRSFYIGYKESEKLEKKINIENFDKDSFNLCFFGTLNNQFEFNKVVNIAKLIKDYNINIYVCGTGEEYEKLYSESLNLPNLKILGWLNKEELQYVLQNSKIGIAPYKSTFDFQMSVSNKFAEYLSYGLPIVLTSGGYMGELIEENKCGINNDNEEEIAKFIIETMENAEIYDTISKNAKKLYKENFVAEKIYSNLADYLEEIGGNKK